MFKRKLLKAIAANWILHSGGAVCRLAHFEYSTKYGMATCHEVVIREKSGLEVVISDKSAVFTAEPGGRVKCPSRHSFLVILQHRAVFKQKLLHIWGRSPSHSLERHHLSYRRAAPCRNDQRSNQHSFHVTSYLPEADDHSSLAVAQELVGRKDAARNAKLIDLAVEKGRRRT